MGEDGARLPFKIDVNGDDYVSPLDALLVINDLQPQVLHGEGEATAESALLNFAGFLARVTGGGRFGSVPLPESGEGLPSLRAALLKSEAITALPTDTLDDLSHDIAARRLPVDAATDQPGLTELDLVLAAGDEPWWLP
jgi:hypothetical protein